MQNLLLLILSIGWVIRRAYRARKSIQLGWSLFIITFDLFSNQIEILLKVIALEQLKLFLEDLLNKEIFDEQNFRFFSFLEALQEVIRQFNQVFITYVVKDLSSTDFNKSL